MKNIPLSEALFNYTKRKLEAGEEKHSRFGDFNYEIEGEEVHIHFSPNQKAEIGSLKKEVVPNRIKELTEMFQEIKEKYPNAKTVNGSSWLYNFESYKRLFPHEYSQNTEISKLCLQGGSGWGQAGPCIRSHRRSRPRRHLGGIDR